MRLEKVVGRVARRINPHNGYFSTSDETYKVPMKLFADNRKRLVSAMKTAIPECKGLVLLQGGRDQGICSGDSSDVGPIFKQEAYFHWTFGVLEPDFYGALCLATGHSYLFMPKLPEEYAVWMGKIESVDETRRRYEVDYVFHVTEMNDVLKKIVLSDKTDDSKHVYVLDGVNTDSKKNTTSAKFPEMENFSIDKETLHEIITELRVVKSADELDVMRYITRVSCDAHMEVMRQIRAGMMEYQCESIFLHDIYYKAGVRHVCYNCICGSGSSGAVLHYGHAGAPNNQPIKDGDMVLFDMGGEYYRFCSDITCSYPVNGKFTANQRVVYEAVLAASRSVIDAIKPGVSYREMHLVANKSMLEKLKVGGLVQGEIKDMMDVNLAGEVFQPHGLGHFIGLDVHDVGGYAKGHPPRTSGNVGGLSALRTARTLQPNMCLTVEPGCYFIDHLLDKAFADSELSKFLVKERVEEFRGFGGVRIEDDCIVTGEGCEVMSSTLPRTVEEIEKFMANR